MADTIIHNQIKSSNSLSVTVVSSSVHQYLNYSKKMQSRLAQINDNVSNVIKESCTGIDSICNKVRQCLCEMDLHQSDKTTYLMDEITETEHEIVGETSKSAEEISQDVDGTFGDISVIETVEDEKFDPKQITEEGPSFTPFFTVLNLNKEDPNNSEPCQKKVLNKTIYSLMNKDECSTKSPDNADSIISTQNFEETISTLCENFELMNELVENINEEITKFSKTTICTNEEKSQEHIENKKINTNLSMKKSIKRLSKINSRQKSIQVGDCFSENEINFIELNNRHSSSFIHPDVYRKRAFTDLYQKLVAQVEANDSLIFFQTLMNRQNKFEKKAMEKCVSHVKMDIPTVNYSVPKKSVSNKCNKIQPPKKCDLSRKYTGSLWFSQKNLVKDKASSRNSSRKDFRSKKTEHNRTVENKSLKTRSDYSSFEQKKNYKKMYISDSNKKLPKFNSLGDVSRKTCSRECTCKMVVENNMVPSPSTKFHLQWLKSKSINAPRRKLKFLDILDDLTNKDLLPLQSEYPRRDNQQPRELDYKDVQDTYLYKLLYGKQGTKNVWKQLLEPTIECSRKNCTLCKYTAPRSENSRRSREIRETFMDKFRCQNDSRSNVIKKLSPYLFDPDKPDGSYSQSIIVMPLRVYYDNFKSNEPPTKLNSPSKPLNMAKKRLLSPTLESKGVKKAEWIAPGVSRNMKVVFDGLPKNPEIQPITQSIKPAVMSPKTLISSARQSTEKTSMKKITSRSFSPKSFTSYCQEIKSANKQPTNLKHHENVALYNKIQADIEQIRNEIYGKKGSATNRKLVANKYGKSVGQRLISFVQHQEPETVKPVIYAMPKLKTPTKLSEIRNAASFSREGDSYRQNLLNAQGLKTKNDAVQINIKKAIDVIESQMVDILYDDSNSVEAFDIMEKEITNVLSLMKCNKKKPLKTAPLRNSDNKEKVAVTPDKDKNASLEEDYNNFDIISDQLFERLQRILDTGSSVSSTPTEGSVNGIQLPKKEEVKKKQKFSSSKKRNKISILSPSTSASLDERMVPKRFSRPNSKKTEKIEAKSKLPCTKPSTNIEPITTEIPKNICGDQNINENIHVNENSTSQNDMEVKQENMVSEVCEEPILEKSAGDFVEPEDIVQHNDVFYDAETATATIDNAVSDDIDEKATTEENPEIPIQVLDSEKNIDSQYISTTNSEMEEFINNEISKVIDSIVTLGQETTSEKIQIEDVITTECLGKENLESSNYDTPHSETIEADTRSLISEPAENDKIIQPSRTLPELETISHPFELAQNDTVSNDVIQSFSTIEIAVKIPIPETAESDTSIHPPKLESDTSIHPPKLASDTSIHPPKLPEIDTILHQSEVDKPADIDGQLHTSESTKFDIGLHPCGPHKIDTKLHPRELPEIDKKLCPYRPPEVKTKAHPSELPEIDKKPQAPNERSYSTFSDQVHKIIRRVEDIYSQLDDIQNSDSAESIPVFKEPNLPDVHSEMFLTPFMHAVKETRKNLKDTNNMAVIQKSPSYYNVMNFLDTLYNIQKELPYEIYVARLHNYAYISHEAIVYHQTEVLHQVDYSTTLNEKPSCLKKMIDEEKLIQNKKVSFLGMHKSSQVALCPFHKVKVVRISSQQFPPLENSSGEEIYEKISVSNKGEHITEKRNEEKKAHQNQDIIELTKMPPLEKVDNSNVPHKHCLHCCVNKNKDSDNKPKKVLCKVHGDVGKVSEVLNYQTHGNPAKQEININNLVDCEKTKKLEMSKIDDKSTQVFCQMLKQENSNLTITDENVCRTSTDEQSIDYPEYLEHNPDDSKSTDKDIVDDSLLDPFYDYTNENISPKVVKEKIQETCENTHVKSAVQNQPKIVVFREVIESPNLLPPLNDNLDNIELYKKNLEKRKEIRLMRKSSVELMKCKIPKVRDNANVVLLKSFYAFVYILMFTALSLDYRCL